MNTTDKISLKKAEAKFDRMKKAVVENPDAKNTAAYRKAKKELGAMRISFRTGHVPHQPNGSAVATPKTLEAKAIGRKTT